MKQGFTTQSKPDSHTKGLSPAQILQRIRPQKPHYRFLQSWDPAKRELWFGCAGNGQGVQIGSSRLLRHANPEEGIVSSKLRPETVRSFRDNRVNVNGSDLLSRVHTHLRDYLHFQDERLFSFLCAWAIGTYLYSLFSHYGYLFLHSVLPRCGKTRVQEVLSHLCFEATGPLNGPTVATIRDTAAEGRTLQLDTLERWKAKSTEAYAAAMEYLDAGFRNGGVVSKMVPLGNGAWRKQLFPVFAPYMLAAINKDSLSDTGLDRSFVVEMKRKHRKGKKKYNFSHCEQESIPLRDDLYTWALQNAELTSRIYESPDLEAEIEGLWLHDRAADIWKPLLAIARTFGANPLHEDLKTLATAMGQDEQAPEEARNLAIVQALRNEAKTNGKGKIVGMTSTLVAHLGIGCGIYEDDGNFENYLHDFLTQWGFEQKSIRLPEGPRRGWELTDSKLAEIEQQLSSFGNGV